MVKYFSRVHQLAMWDIMVAASLTTDPHNLTTDLTTDLHSLTVAGPTGYELTNYRKILGFHLWYNFAKIYLPISHNY